MDDFVVFFLGSFLKLGFATFMIFVCNFHGCFVV